MDEDQEDGHLPPLFPHRKAHDSNNRILLAAIISLFVVTALVILLHLYARYVLQRRRAAHGGSAAHSLAVRVARAPEPERPVTGLDPMVIAALPLFIFERGDGCGDAVSVECAVCLSFLENGEMARDLPNCKHMFHSHCIDKWLSSKPTCPVCRTEAEPRVQPELREPPAGWDAPAPVAVEVSSKVGSSSSRLGSLQRMLSREKSSRRIQFCGHEDDIQDMERQ